MCQTNLFVCERVKPKLSMVAPHPTVTDPSKGQLLHSSIWDIRYLPFLIRFGLKYLAHVWCEYQISNILLTWGANIQYFAHVRCISVSLTRSPPLLVPVLNNCWIWKYWKYFKFRHHRWHHHQHHCDHYHYKPLKIISQNLIISHRLALRETLIIW